MATAKPQAITWDDAALDRMIEQDPHKSGRHHARLAEYGTPVWAIIAYLPGTEGDIARTAAGYDIPESAVQAAIHYDEQHRALIDALLLLQQEAYER